MKNKISIFILPLIVVLISTGCSHESIATWTAKGSVWFATTDTVNFTFAVVPAGTTVDTVHIPISYAGKFNNSDLQIELEVVSSARNSQTKYEILNPVVVPANSESGDLAVKVYRTPNLDIAADTITFAIRSSEDLEVGLRDYLQKTLVIYNKYVKPSWWDSRMSSYIGDYSDEKLEIIYKVLGSIDNILGTEDSFSGKTYILNKYNLDLYIKTYQPKYANGSSITFD